MTEEIFHAGELALQERLGAREQLARFAPKGIRSYMPDQHRDFFAMLSYIFVGAVDQTGQPWASVLAGPAGFISSPNPEHLEIKAAVPPGDPLSGVFQLGSKVGLVGIQLSTKRRNRMNGVVVPGQGEHLTVRVDQSYGNCPKYIQPRQLAIAPRLDAPKPVIAANALTPDIAQVIEAADLFFIASRSATLGPAPSDGVDMSHRGGPAGFVTVEAPQTLSFPDYRGNRFFNTLGNIQTDPRVCLLFLDFAGDRLIQVAGRAEVLWNEDERATRITVEAVRVNPNVLMVEAAGEG